MSTTLKNPILETCRVCERPFWRYTKGRKDRCIDCAREAATAAMVQMMHKSGPVYDKWRRNIKRAARNL